METQSPQQVLNDAMWRMSDLETKIKLNEQNLFNVQERMQLLNRNFLDLKKELRDRVDNLTDDLHDFEKKISSLNEKIARVPKPEEVEQIKKFHKSINVFKPDMSVDEAKKILDDVLKKLEKGE